MADMLSQEEIDALLNGDEDSNTEGDSVNMTLLTDEEKDALGEIGNISMGTAATTLFTLLSQKVNITTPRVSETTLLELVDKFDRPCVTINVHYTMGIEGSNLLIMNEKDVKVITDLMMGSDGTNVPDELTEMHLSAIGEAMNQMIGSSSTSLSEMLGQKIDISPPEAIYDDIENLTEDKVGLNPKEKIVMIAFRMTIGELIDSEIMQLMPMSVAKQLVENLMRSSADNTTSEASAEASSETSHSSPQPARPEATKQSIPVAQVQTPPQQPKQPVNAQSVQFESFGEGVGQQGMQGDITLIRDVPLEISVELGRTTKKISEILDFATGSVIELNRLVGESLDILANGKMIAKGEVVVVDENYGVRITEIVVPNSRWIAN